MSATRVHRQALMPYTADQMFGVVNDVAAYARFLPGCLASEVIEESPETMLARIELGKGPVRFSFTTRNRLDRPHAIDMTLAQGPFRRLQGQWRFSAIGAAGCRVELELDFELADGLASRVLGTIFAQVADGLVESFCRRADDLYG
jgi:ribosome-associated toxin RatA of RatAB toxin-antitoxin module